MIEEYRFGHIKIQGREYKDDLTMSQEQVIDYPWWRKSGHRVEVEDVRKLLDLEPNVLVLGQGQPGMMKSTQNLRQHLQKVGIRLIEKPSDQAAKSLNQLLEQGEKVCAGFHLTC